MLKIPEDDTESRPLSNEVVKLIASTHAGPNFNHNPVRLLSWYRFYAHLLIERRYVLLTNHDSYFPSDEALGALIACAPEEPKNSEMDYCDFVQRARTTSLSANRGEFLFYLTQGIEFVADYIRHSLQLGDTVPWGAGKRPVPFSENRFQSIVSVLCSRDSSRADVNSVASIWAAYENPTIGELTYPDVEEWSDNERWKAIRTLPIDGYGNRLISIPKAAFYLLGKKECFFDPMYPLSELNDPHYEPLLLRLEEAWEKREIRHGNASAHGNEKFFVWESFILWQESYFFAWVTERLPPPPDHFAEFTLTIADCARELWDRFPDISSQKVAERIVRNAIENTKNCIRTNKKGRSVLLELADWKRFLRSYKHRPKKRTGGGDDDDLPNYL